MSQLTAIHASLFCKTFDSVVVVYIYFSYINALVCLFCSHFRLRLGSSWETTINLTKKSCMHM